LPADERPLGKWNSNPYRLDSSGEGRSEDDGAYFLLPYWMGRYYGFIEEPSGSPPMGPPTNGREAHAERP